VTNNESFEQIKTRFPEIEFYCDENIPKILVGNKDDDNNEKKKIISTHHGQELAENNNLLFFEASVKDNKNVTEAFNQLAKLVLRRRLNQSKPVENVVSVEQKQPRKKDKTRFFCIV
jgi:Ras-related protein Rab-18